MLKRFEVGKRFPSPVPGQEGAVMELWKSGLTVIIQMPKLRRQELKAFKKGFKRYAYLESNTPVPIALWVFDFPPPHGAIDCNFNARIVKQEYIEIFLDTREGIKNAVTFYLLDGQILKGIKMVGLHQEAIELFHSTIQKQIANPYTQAEYDRYLAGLYQFSSEELLSMGRQFKF